MSDWRAQKNPAHGRVFSFLGSGGAFAENVNLYAEPFPLVSNL